MMNNTMYFHGAIQGAPIKVKDKIVGYHKSKGHLSDGQNTIFTFEHENYDELLKIIKFVQDACNNYKGNDK